MYLKLFKQKKESPTMISTIKQVVLFHKRSVYPFPVAQILNPYHAKFELVLVVCREGGLFWVVFLFVFFIIPFFRRQI